MSEKVAVLMGGMSPEREVSLVSGEAVADALTQEGYKVVKIDADRDLAAQLARTSPDIIFNALHGEWGEDGRVQGVLDLYGKPYTHSGVMASALAMDKHRAKIVCKAAGINVPKGKLVLRTEAARRHVLKPPYVIKPNAQGSSVGVYVILEGANSPPLDVAMNEKMGAEVLAETFAPGRELTVTVLNGKALCTTEIIVHTAFYDYEAKYAEGGSSHIVPAEIPDLVAQTCMEWAEIAHKSLGCRGMTRSDFRYDDTNVPKNPKKTDIVNKIVMLELNTQPGMTPTSLAPEQAQHVGMDFRQLCRWIVEDASAPR
ncbi:MAG: D-alanine--D-alanine ligase [Robiginitomaculum sp.]|nr:MAG: D-alanine--D-alanine ligase [Robiginitomaculum sp.]